VASEIIISGISEFDKAIKFDIAKSDAAARNIVTKGALIIERKAKEEFRARPSGSQRTAKSGRVYYQGAPKYPATPPQPTQRSGNLRNSIKTQQVTSLGVGRWQSDTGPSVKYAGFVEYGTSRSREFPYMTPGVKNSNEEINTIAQEEWRLAQE
jgi:HK97 gp10 family phage protein